MGLPFNKLPPKLTKKGTPIKSAPLTWAKEELVIPVVFASSKKGIFPKPTLAPNFNKGRIILKVKTKEMEAKEDHNN